MDAFAQFCNRKADIFFSRLDETGSSGINFFSQRLFPSLGYYCFPPPGVILATIIHLAWFKVSGLLVIPAWPSASFWSNILPDGKHLPRWADRCLRFRANFVVDPEIISSTFKSPSTFDSLVIKFDFARVKEDELFLPNFVPDCCFEGGCILCLTL